MIVGVQDQPPPISKLKRLKEVTYLRDLLYHSAQRAPSLLSSVNEEPMKLSKSKNVAKARHLSELMRLYRAMAGNQFKCIAKTSAVTACSKFVRVLLGVVGWIRTVESPMRDLKTIAATTSHFAT